MTEKPATQIVLHTPELLASILSHLLPHDLLLRVPLVNHKWNQIILTTPYLQQLLFFRPSNDKGTPIVNPLLKRYLPIFFQNERCDAKEFESLFWIRDVKAFKRREASWRRMLVVNGGDSITPLKVIERTQTMGGWSERKGVLHCEDGLRMGMLWDLTKDWCMWNDTSNFLLNWREDLLPVEERHVDASWYDIDSGCGQAGWGRMLMGLLPQWRSMGRLVGQRRRGQLVPVYVDREMDGDGEGEGEEREVVELVLSCARGCLGRETGSRALLGEVCRSEDKRAEKVRIEYGQWYRIPNPIRWVRR